MTMTNMKRISLTALGCWVVFDGAFSIVEYLPQSLPEHAVRIIRIVVGCAVVYLALRGS